MPYSTITSKGQTTLPLKIREALQLKPGDRISYEIQGDTVVIKPQQSAMDVFGRLKPPADLKGLSFNEARKRAKTVKLLDIKKGVK
jgi:AbrB family looped-hinge helix DNA binding protein